MKRIAMIAAAALTLVGPLAATSAAADPPRHNDRGSNYDHNDRNGRYDNNGRRDNRHQWRRGERLGAYERAHYRQVDWRRDHLREPPRGYHYVRDDRGETLLVGIATGAILGIILANQ